jgi:hypothetical protein
MAQQNRKKGERGMRNSCKVFALLAVVILAIPLAAQVRTADGRPAPNGELSYSTAPMQVVYEFFIKEFVALEDFAERLEAKGQSARETRALLKELTGLDGAGFDMFAATARRCVARINEADQALRDAADKAKSGAAAEPAAAAQTWRARQNAAMDAMTEVRRRLDARTFTALEQRIRQHVIPKMTVLPAPEAASGKEDDES